MTPDENKVNETGSGSKVPVPDNSHTDSGAPTDRAHQDDGDGTLTGAVPAGLSLKQLREAAESDKTDDAGTS
ncbi:hypothetical protein [Roseomonas sp. BN140053]|uniref:hypothetical protein n=1 Tax=Roseomonas sp. BN140053 TaxID=3391898 RepID=UPI0039E9AC50